ncbi:hypothetical protein IOK_06969 [Yersinia enterocolitica subsp. palearctica PhRBD_Ye1]|nr:hypothetical protein IOK_06969 [Yersinia enterocolitica subsp. palearctica PhRBD_Ye1]
MGNPSGWGQEMAICSSAIEGATAPGSAPPAHAS